MHIVSLLAADVFNMPFDQVFVAGQVTGQDEFIKYSRWKLFINGQEAADMEAIGERRIAGKNSAQRVVMFKGQLDNKLFDLAKDEVLLVQQ